MSRIGRSSCAAEFASRSTALHLARSSPNRDGRAGPALTPVSCEAWRRVRSSVKPWTLCNEKMTQLSALACNCLLLVPLGRPPLVHGWLPGQQRVGSVDTVACACLQINCLEHARCGTKLLRSARVICCRSLRLHGVSNTDDARHLHVPAQGGAAQGHTCAACAHAVLDAAIVLSQMLVATLARRTNVPTSHLVCSCAGLPDCCCFRQRYSSHTWTQLCSKRCQRTSMMHHPPSCGGC